MKILLILSLLITLASCKDDSTDGTPTANAVSDSDLGVCAYKYTSYDGHYCQNTIRSTCSTVIDYLESSLGGADYGDFFKTDKKCGDLGCNDDVVPGSYQCPKRITASDL